MGYFGLLDLGIGRAVTHAVAQRLAMENQKIGDIVWPSFRLSAVIGSLGSALIIITEPWITSAVQGTIEANLTRELRTTVIILALSLPFVIVATVLRGVMEAQQRFGLINLIRFPTASLMFFGTWVISRHTNDLPILASFLVITRAIGAVLMLHFVRRSDKSPIWSVGTLRGIAGLLRFGAWITVGSVVAPILVNIDRFLISWLISLEAVTYYVTPHELMSRTWLVASSIMAVYFPALTEHSLEKTKNRDQRGIYEEAIWFTAALSLPLTLTLGAFSSELLQFWLGAAIAVRSADVLRILGFGGFVASLTLVPNMLLQATGRPRTVALIQIAELPVYICIFIIFTSTHSIEGAALAWIIRVVTEAFLLDALAQRVRNKKRSFSVPILVCAGAMLFLLVGFGSLPLRSAVWLAGVTMSGIYLMRGWQTARRCKPNI